MNHKINSMASALSAALSTKWVLSSLMLSGLILSGCQSSGLYNSDTASNDATHEVETIPASLSQVAKTKTLKSKYSFNETVTRLENAITSKNMTVFSKIDHAAAAQQAGLSMQPATLLIFGNPKAGTPLMQKDPSFALQLPLKVLVTEVDGRVLVMFNTTEALIENSGINYSDVENTLAGAEKLITKTVIE
ncbi:DUF302 domain-containing protein [Psychrobacter sanguinis]|uniref:DUF302 domain-containing protein n=1 Tax=Psychrobacter sanguinis TaxID=861445 RepID=UPI00020C7ECA|nr:DUF302 domain-containing protein [Psychrobacter sanguinis]EGK10068.1 CrcB family protein [Psychrobacter sp. 1501(2011)]MCC3344985.1 DUF302 domain-containing protein [Psychrobacter sanguinis]MCD9152528.1 DUF302 domain-containing protein [Psychrobacter sanguinis]